MQSDDDGALQSWLIVAAVVVCTTVSVAVAVTSVSILGLVAAAVIGLLPAILIVSLWLGWRG